MLERVVALWRGVALRHVGHCQLTLCKLLTASMLPPPLQKAAFRDAKRGLLACKRWPFAARMTAF